MSARENIAKNLIEQLTNMTDPAPGLVSRKYFDVTKLAITQFPAILVNSTTEEREDVSMDLRQGTIIYELRCYLRGTELDTLRNELIERVEETLETQRGRAITVSATNIHNVTTRINEIQVIERELPLSEVLITVEVRYTYRKGVL
jgi:hypothetical protein